MATGPSVNLRALARGPQLPVHGSSTGPLGINGRPAAGLPVRRSTGRKAQLAAAVSRPAGRTALRASRGAHGPASLPPGTAGAAPGTARAVLPHPAAAISRAPRIPPTTINASFNGVRQFNANCSGCQPPDPNAAVGTTQFAEAVNLRLQVYNRAGARCAASA